MQIIPIIIIIINNCDSITLRNNIIMTNRPKCVMRSRSGVWLDCVAILNTLYIYIPLFVLF